MDIKETLNRRIHTWFSVTDILQCEKARRSIYAKSSIITKEIEKLTKHNNGKQHSVTNMLVFNYS